MCDSAVSGQLCSAPIHLLVQPHLLRSLELCDWASSSPLHLQQKIPPGEDVLTTKHSVNGSTAPAVKAGISAVPRTRYCWDAALAHRQWMEHCWGSCACLKFSGTSKALLFSFWKIELKHNCIAKRKCLDSSNFFSQSWIQHFPKLAIRSQTPPRDSCTSKRETAPTAANDFTATSKSKSTQLATCQH